MFDWGIDMGIFDLDFFSPVTIIIIVVVVIGYFVLRGLGRRWK